MFPIFRAMPFPNYQGSLASRMLALALRVDILLMLFREAHHQVIPGICFRVQDSKEKNVSLGKVFLFLKVQIMTF